MADDAPITGAPTRAPASDQPRDALLSHARTIQVAAEAIDAVVLGVELMLADQRRIMGETSASTFLLGNELWGGAATLLAMVRERASAIGEAGEAIEVAGMASPAAGTAA